MMTATEQRIIPFSNGTQYADWTSVNCDHCKKQFDEKNNQFQCDIEEALDFAYLDDGTITPEIAHRMGYENKMPPKYCWMCPEVDWTEERKAEVRARKEAES